MWRVRIARDARRKLVIAKKWEAQRDELLKLYANKRQRKKAQIYYSLRQITSETRDSIINAYYRNTKKKYLLSLAEWARKSLQRGLDKSELKSESGNKSRMEDTPIASLFGPNSRRGSEFSKKQPKTAIPKLNAQSSFSSAVRNNMKKNLLFKKYKGKVENGMDLGRSKSRFNTPRSTIVSVTPKFNLSARRELPKPPAFKYCPCKEELVKMILNA
eukprot:TRINITY_DN20692_c0_g2_i3.p1 TRINITY_DN20692_c0_g2~~TRINITY_DN20692_c0_g2_i3.p1  ORF type:complete len:216 (-),score=51.24 TRINITY_DN20692_c0_g2_i3:98-745(-)